ncbi:beta-lactamase/transpeptidase-like protein [Phlebopus sp. FC_14]|nr:beta-lactamase/transpeptidase-like protein [Phlebopus sp. FC_14]
MGVLATVLGVVLAPVLTYTYPHLLPQFTSSSDHATSVITPALSAYIDETRAAWNITGLSVAVVSKHGPPEFHTWGYRTEDGDEMTSDTLFHMASVSKAFCATALGLLIDDFAKGKNVTALPSELTEITWRTKVKDLLPGEWQLMDEWASERADLRDILSHVSGVPRHDYSYGPYDTARDAIIRLKYLRPAFELREQWSYNNIMFIVGAHIIATYSGQPYTSFIEERVFSPLGMTESTFSPAKAESSGKYTQGWTKGGRRIPEWFSEETAYLKAGPGGVISNAIDMSKWIATWLNEGVHEGETVFPLSVYKNASYAYSVSSDHPASSEYSIAGYGMGWFRRSYLGHDVVFHSGAIPGFSTLVSFLPSDELGVTVFANGGDMAAPAMDISNRILDQALHLGSSPTSPSSSPNSSRSKKTTTTSEHHTRNLTLPIDNFAGTYTNPGYGTLTLCSPASKSAYCSQVQQDFTAVDTAAQDGRSAQASTPELLAEWQRVWSSHIRMRYHHDLLFEIEFTSLFPNGYGKDTTPFETGEIGTSEGVVEFVVEGDEVVGFGLRGLVGQLTERERIYTSVRDRAEVWFDRVNG